MYKTCVAAAVLAMFFTACGGGGPASAPEDTFHNFQDVLDSEDWEGLMEFMPPSERTKAEEGIKQAMENPMGLAMMAGEMGIKPEELKEMDIKAVFARVIETQMAKESKLKETMLNATIKETKIDGDNATITIEHAGKTDTVKLTKVDGLWYIKDY